VTNVKLNRTAYAILGLLMFSPRTGYDIKREVETKIRHFWNESYGHLYPILKRLHEGGLIDKETVAQASAPDKHVYTLTEAGRAAFFAWMREPSDIPVIRNELLLKLFFGSFVPADLSREHILHFREAHHALLATFAETEAQLMNAQDADSVYALITLRAGIHYCHAILNWCAETLDRLDQITPP
jgi:DNA-binding PadR family transcriptional regulator